MSPDERKSQRVVAGAAGPQRPPAESGDETVRPAQRPLPVTVRQDIARTIFAVLFIFGLIAGCFWILRPFIPALIWATMIVVSTWSLMLNVQARFWNRRWIAVTLMMSALVLAFVIPFWLAISTLVDHAEQITTWAGSLSRAHLPALPAWIEGIPYAGRKITAFWNDIAMTGPSAVTAQVEPYARGIARWFAGQVGGFGMVALQFILALILAAVMYTYGESAAAGVRLSGAATRGWGWPVHGCLGMRRLDLAGPQGGETGAAGDPWFDVACHGRCFVVL